MEFLINSLQGSVSAIIPMIVLLGLLIFVHELGHFLVAKYYKVRVEVFSLGFGPKLFKFKRGDTVYAISAIPLGGYVKMFGDDPTADIGSDQKAHSFLHKPVGARINIVLAGPLMNFFFAIVLFAGVAMIGEQALAPKLGDLQPTTEAFRAGLRSGDTVVAVNEKKIKTWDQLQDVIESHADKPVKLAIERSGGAKDEITLTPKLVVNKNVLSWDRHVGEVDGLTYSSRASVIALQGASSAASQAGLKTGDLVVSVNGTKLDRWREMMTSVKAAAQSGELVLEVKRGLFDEKRTSSEDAPVVKVTLPIAAELRGESAEKILSSLGVESPELYLAGVEKKAPAALAGLQVGDRLMSIDDTQVTSFEQVATIIRSYGKRRAEAAADSEGKNEPLKVTVVRDGKPVSVSIAPNERERMNNQGREERRFEIGIRPYIIEAPASTVEISSTGLVDTVSRGFSQTMKWTNLTVLSFVRLFQAEVSAKNIGGFISIGQMAKKSWQMGPAQFLNIMAIISINLFVLNLLPVPVLDGGHLVFYTIEALRGAPLSMRKMEIAQQVGLVLLLGLMVFALFNDVTRIFN